jgi:hypothetical protein
MRISEMPGPKGVIIERVEHAAFSTGVWLLNSANGKVFYLEIPIIMDELTAQSAGTSIGNGAMELLGLESAGPPTDAGERRKR